MLREMPKILCVGAFLIAVSVSAQEHKPPPCSAPSEARDTVNTYLDKALSAAKQIEQDFTRSQVIAEVASAKVCLQDFKTAAQLSDLASPSGSESASQLGRAVVAAGKLEEIPSLLSAMTHGTDSFLYGVASGLAEARQFSQADQWVAKIPSPEVRSGAQSEITAQLYKAGKIDEARRRTNAQLEKADPKVKARVSSADIELEMAGQSGDWQAAHHLLDKMPDSIEKRYMTTMMAVAEAEANADGAEKDLLAAARNFNSTTDPPFVGYLIAAHLAGMKNLPAAINAAEAVRDDEWNRKCWTTIALFQAEEGHLADTKASIAKIGTGKLVHPLGDAPGGRDMARIFVAEGLAAGGRPDAAQSLLDDREDHEDFKDRYFLTAQVDTIVARGDIPAAQAIVEKELKNAVVLDEDLQRIAVALSVGWYAKDRTAAESWIAAQKQPEIQAACWSALASAAIGNKPVVTHYFMNWD